jgi:hypothetical protein
VSVTESDPPPLSFLTRIGATPAPCDLPQSWICLGTPCTFKYLARLPDTEGSFGTFTTLGPGQKSLCDPPPPSSAEPQRFELDLAVGESGAGLLPDAQALLALVPSSGKNGTPRSRIEARLSAIGKRPVLAKADAEANLADLLDAVDETRNLGIDATALRLGLDELIRYWEARWSTL